MHTTNIHVNSTTQQNINGSTFWEEIKKLTKDNMGETEKKVETK